MEAPVLADGFWFTLPLNRNPEGLDTAALERDLKRVFPQVAQVRLTLFGDAVKVEGAFDVPQVWDEERFSDWLTTRLIRELF